MIITTNTPFQKTVCPFSERVSQFPPDRSTGFPSSLPVEYDSQKQEQEYPDEYQVGVFRVFSQPFIYFFRYIIHVKALFRKRFGRCS